MAMLGCKESAWAIGDGRSPNVSGSSNSWEGKLHVLKRGRVRGEGWKRERKIFGTKSGSKVAALFRRRFGNRHEGKTSNGE